jgi:hypothetical protein
MRFVDQIRVFRPIPPGFFFAEYLAVFLNAEFPACPDQPTLIHKVFEADFIFEVQVVYFPNAAKLIVCVIIPVRQQDPVYLVRALH